jgi:integron integrase
MPEPLQNLQHQPRLLDRVRLVIRARHYSPRTETAYVAWIRRFILFHGKRHPVEMGEPEVTQFLSALASERHVSASTQNQALSALLFLYADVLGRDLDWLDRIVRAQRPVRVPVVLSRAEVAAVLSRLRGDCWLMASLMYGSGLRVLERAGLRVKDLDLDRLELVVRDGKGRKDRVSVLPQALRMLLARHLERVKRVHEADLRAGRGGVALPDALGVKYPRAAWEWGWQWVFPATRVYIDQATGERRRHHLHESVVQRAFKTAVREAGLTKSASCHCLRHSFATHLLESGV